MAIIDAFLFLLCYLVGSRLAIASAPACLARHRMSMEASNVDPTTEDSVTHWLSTLHSKLRVFD